MEIRNRWTSDIIAEGETLLAAAESKKADLSGADLWGINLRGADLSGADFRGAKYGDDLLLKYLAIGPIGSRNDYLQVFITCNNVAVRTGCFSGTLDDLAERTDRDDYNAAISFIKNTVESVRK